MGPHEGADLFFAKNLRNRSVSYKFVTERLLKEPETKTKNIQDVWFLVQKSRRKMRRDVFQAIADPTRREIIHMVARRSMNIDSVAENFEISRPAISKHIRILTECGLLTVTRRGRERYCEARLQQLGEVSEWVEQYRTFWNHKLDALEQFLNEQPVNHKPNKKSKK